MSPLFLTRRFHSWLIPPTALIVTFESTRGEGDDACSNETHSIDASTLTPVQYL